MELGKKNKQTTEAYWTPALKLSLLSWSKLDDLGTSTTIHQSRCILFSRNNGNKDYGSIKKRSEDSFFVAFIMLSCYCSNMNILPFVTLSRSARAVKTSAIFGEADMLWHDSMAHVNMQVVEEVIRMSQYGMRMIDKMHGQNCTSCVQTNCTKLQSNGSLIGNLEEVLIQSNMPKLMQITAYRWKQYFLTLTASHQGYIWVYLLKRRLGKAEHCFQSIAGLDHNAKRMVKDFIPTMQLNYCV